MRYSLCFPLNLLACGALFAVSLTGMFTGMVVFTFSILPVTENLSASDFSTLHFHCFDAASNSSFLDERIEVFSVISAWKKIGFSMKIFQYSFKLATSWKSFDSFITIILNRVYQSGWICWSKPKTEPCRTPDNIFPSLISRFVGDPMQKIHHKYQVHYIC